MDEDKVQKERRDQDEKSTAQRAGILGIPYLDTRTFEDTIILAEGVLDIAAMRQNYIVPLIIGNNEQPWRFGVTTQTPQTYIGELTKQYNDNGHNINFFLISLSSFDKFMDRFDPVVKVVHEDIKIARDGDSNTIEEVSKTLNSVGSDEIFDYLIDQADKLGASDIHIENGRTSMRIRMRIDGVLHPVADLNSDRYRMILAALATRANLSTASTESQSGHIQKEITVDGKTHTLNLRAETIPTMYGQDAVLRLFNYDETSLNLDRLGISSVERQRLDEIISHPRGMVLMVGPTGSGKTTTLYSIINALNTTARKIITLEDPVEYSISGISQIPVNTTSGQSFGDNLRSVLRLDPDVLMIGEIRDADTAKTAIQASITGHLVLSSFHAGGGGLVVIKYATGSMTATGGVVTTDGGYTIHTFYASDSFSYEVYDSNATYVAVDALIVAGGGGGGFDLGAAGGGGGVIYETGRKLKLGGVDYSVVVGTAGAGGVTDHRNGYNGGNSSFASHTAIGGGGGGYWQAVAGVAGGSGGGGGASGGSVGGIGGAGTTGQGYAGGAGAVNGLYASGSGGGAGGPGSTGVAAGAAGGIGLQYDISGTPTYYAGGGGAGGTTGVGLGGLGGGGRGGQRDGSILLTNGEPNTGGGGGASAGVGVNGGSGGSGIVIIRYLTGSMTATGGTITTSGSYTIHTFTSSGTFTVN